jgi:hypothetical protein
MKKNNMLNSKIAKYSILAGATLSMLAACKKDEPDNNDPNINETDITPDITLAATASGSFTDIDLNSDGIIDVSVGIANYTYTSYGYNTNFNYASVNGENGAEILTETISVNLGGSAYDIELAKALSEGNTIGVSQVIWYGSGYLGFQGVYSGNNLSYGNFLSADKYVGVKFLVGTNTHYGWVRMSLNADASSLIIKEYAYHVTPNTAIAAGDK